MALLHLAGQRVQLALALGQPPFEVGTLLAEGGQLVAGGLDLAHLPLRSLQFVGQL